MKITKIPAPYSPAYRDALFRISATADEIVELDIFDHAGTGIIGRKRLYGSTVYDVNVAGYAQGQFEVARCEPCNARSSPAACSDCP